MNFIFTLLCIFNIPTQLINPSLGSSVVERQAENLKVNGSVPFLNNMSLLKKNLIKIAILLTLLLELNYKILVTILNLFNLFSLEGSTYLFTLYWLVLIAAALYSKNNSKRSVLFITYPESRHFFLNLGRFIDILRGLNLNISSFLWKPLFKKTSYFGFFNSSRFSNKNYFKKHTK